MFRPDNPTAIIIVVVVIVLIFGAPKLPMMAKNLGKSMKIFKSEVKDLRSDKDEDETTSGDHAYSAPREITDASASHHKAPGTTDTTSTTDTTYSSRPE